MKKFMIFLLMTVLLIGTSQARSEAALFKNAGLKLPSWISQGSHSFFTDAESVNTVNVFVVGPSHACQSDVVTLTAFVSGYEGSTPLSYQWRLNGQAIPGASSATYAFSVADLPQLNPDTLAYDFDVYVWADGCQATYSAVHLFTVSPMPVILVDAPVVCHGEQSLVTANAYTSGDEQPYMWIWTNGSEKDTTYVNTHLFSVGSNYSVIALYQDFSCNNMTPTTFEVKDTTQNLSNITLTPSAETVCQGALASFTLTDPNTNFDPTYAWYVDGALIPEATGTTYAFNVDGEGNHTVKVVATYLCDTKEASVNVNALATPSVVIVGENAVCNGATTTLTAAVLPATPTTGNYQFTWSPSGGNNQTATVGAGTYTVTVKDPNSQCSVIADAFTVTEFGTDVVLDAVEQTICEGESAVLHANTEGWTGSVAYLWSTNATTESITVSPTTTTTYTVTATLDGNNNCQVVRTITVFVNPKPTAPVFKTTTFNICENNQATIEINSPVAGNHYIWYLNGIEVPGENLSTITLNFFYPGTYTINAAVVDANGCVSDLATTAATVTVNPGPSLVQIHGDNVICQGTSATLTASVLPAGLTGVTYSWSDGTTGADHITTNVSGVYTVTASVNGCEAVATDFTVYTFGTDIQLTASSTDVCAGEAVVLNANADGWADNITYNWGVGTNPTAATTTVYPSATTTYTVTTTLTNSNGATCTYNDGITITVHQAPAAPTIAESAQICHDEYTGMDVNPISDGHWYQYIEDHLGVVEECFAASGVPGPESGLTFVPYGAECTTLGIPNGQYRYHAWIPGDTIFTPIITNVCETFGNAVPEYICQGDMITLSANSANADHYIWYHNGVEIPGENLAVLSMALNEVGVHQFAARAVSADGCPSELSAYTVVNVEAAPSNLTITGTNNICQGEQATITASATGASTYTWSNGESTPSIQVGSGVYSVIATSEHGCTAASDNFTVNSVGADLIIVANTTGICAGESVTLTANAQQWTGYVSYEWSAGVNNPNANTVNVTPTTTTTYTVTATSTTETGTCTTERSITITVFDTPATPTVTILDDDNTICEGAQATIKANVTGTDPYTYVWYENGIEIPGHNLDTIVVSPSAGTYDYKVKVISVHGCSSAVASQGATLTVLHNPTIEIMGDPIVCDTSIVVLMANLNDTTGSGNYNLLNYDWRIYNYSLTPLIGEFPNINDIASTAAIDTQLVVTLGPNFLTNQLTAQDNPYIITVSVANDNGCVATSAPFYLYVGENPTVAVTVDNDTICPNGEITATAHLGNYNMDNIVYQWYTVINNDTVAIPYGTSSSVTLSLPSTAQIFVEVTQTTTQCTAFGYDSVFVVAPPQIDNILVINNGHLAENVCEGAEIFVAAYLHDPVTGQDYIDSSLTYVWYENGFLMPLVDGPYFNKQLTIIDEDPAHYIYQAFINYGMPGCEAVPVASDTIEVKRNPIVIIDGVHHICFQGVDAPNVHLTAWVDGATDLDATYKWYKNGMLTHNDLTFLNLYNEMLEPSYQDPYIYMVEVINGDGCTSFSEPFEVNIHDIPYVNVTASETEICKGGSVDVRANLNDYNETELTFQWYENELNLNHILPGYTHEFQTFTPEVTTDYIVEVIHLLNDNTNEYSICAAYDTITIVVNNIPVVDSITTDLTNGNVLCEGAQFTLTAHISGGVAGGEVYTWYRNGEIIPGATGATYTDSPVTVDGDVTVYNYTVSVAQTAAGCQSEVFATPVAITINPNPTLAIETDPIVCVATENNIVMVAHLDPTPATPYTYTWYEDNAIIASGSSNDTLKVTRPYRDYPYNFSVSTVNEYGCHATASTVVYVNDNPVVNTEVTENNICEGGEITLTANLNDWNADQLVYQWYDNGNIINGATSLSYTVVPTVGNHSYTFNVEQLTSGCTATSTALDVTVNHDPVIDSITTDLTDGNVLCEGAQFTLTAHVSGGVTGGEVYTWYRNGEIIPDATGATYTDSPVAVDGDVTVYNYTVAVAQTAAGCGSAVFATPVAITINPNPTLAIETDPIVCVATQNNIVMIAHIDPTPATPYTYTWYEDNAIIASGSSNDTLKVTRAYRDYPYNFSVSTVNEYGCIVSASTEVYVNTNPVVNIEVTENNICEGGEITLTANLNDWNADQLVYQWYDNGNLINGATSLSYTVVPTVGNHSYTFSVEQLTSGCTASSTALDVTVHADPVIDNVTLSTYVACQGAQVEITANVASFDASLGTPVYTWYRNGILIPGATAATIYDSPVTVDNNTQQFIYTAVVTLSASGCQSAAVSSTALTIYPNPHVQITGDQHICVTMPVMLAANVDTIGTDVGHLHYTWYESGQIRDNMAYNLGDNQFYQEYFYARVEPYRFTVNVERDDVPAGCASMSQEFLVWVYEQPVVNITASETEICTNGEVTLTANLDNYNAYNLTYQWYEVREQQDSMAIGYTSNGDYIWYVNTTTYHYNIPGATSPTYTANYAETTTVGVSVVQAHTLCYDTDEITITVNPIPVVTDITVNGEHAITVCDGAQVTVAATIDPADAEGAVYTWFRNGELIEGATQASFSENVYTTTNHITTNQYTAIVTLPASGCVSTLSTMAGTVVINPAPSTVTISGNNVICENDSTTLTAYSDVTGTWTWSTGSHDSTITVPAGVYTVTMTTAEGCEMTSEPFTVEALGTDLFVTASATSICRGDHTTLYADQDGWAGNVSYQWDAQAGNSTSTTVDVQPDSTTTYHVTATVTSTNGTCNKEGIITIIVHQLPEQVVVTPSTTTICESQQITFNASGNATAYIWYQNGVVIPGENQAQLTVNFNEAGTYTFASKAINEEGCVSAIASDPVTVTVNPAPSTVSITGNNVICENDSTVLTAYSDVTGTWTWSTGSHANSITVPAGVYTVTMTTAEGCEMTSEPFAVEAFGTQMFVTASETSICRGEHTTLYVTQEGWEGNVSFQWDAQAGNSTANTVDVQPDSTTTYHVTATVNSTNGSCTAAGQVTIIVNQLPEQVVVTANTTTICEAQQITFNASGNATGYIWYQNGVEIPGENQAQLIVNFNEAGTYTIAAKAINEEGCVSAIASDPVTVTVNPAPSTVSITGNNVICENDSTVLTAYSDVTGTWTWSTGSHANSITVPAGVYTVTMTTAEGCEMTSEPFAVEAFGTQMFVTASETSICRGEHTTLYVTQEGWEGNVSFQWDAQAGNSTANTVDVQPDSTTTYHVTATVNSTNGSCTAAGQVTIIVNQLPEQVVVTANTTTICEAQQITFNASGNATGYIWYQNGVEIPGENQAQLIVNFNEAGTYTIAAKAINEEGCVSAIASDPVTVTVNPAPSTVSITGNNVICENDSTVLTAYSDVTGTWTWSTGSHANSITVPAGVYTVTMTTAEGCEMTSEPFAVEAFGTQMFVTASETSICRGEHTTLYVTQEGWEGNVSFQWDAQAGNSTANTVDVTPTQTTTYHVTATVNSTNGSCTAAGEVTIIVTPRPAQVVVTATTASTICEGEQVTMHASGNATSYIWYQNGVEIPGENQADLTVNFYNEGVYTFAARAINEEGCVSALASDPITVTVNSAPESVVISGQLTICDGGSTTLYADVTPNVPATYVWYKDGVVIPNETNNYLVVTTSGSYRVDATTNNCTTSSEAVVVTVEQTPQLQLTATESTICQFGTTVITAEATGWNNNNVIYTWSNGYVGSAYTFTPNVAGDYTFAVTASQATSGCVATDQITIHVDATPAKPVINLNYTEICDGGQVVLTVTNDYSTYGTPVYTWYRNGQIIPGATLATLTDSPIAVDGDVTTYTYNATVTFAASGCTSANSDNTIVTVVPTPVVAVSLTGNSTICEGGSTTLNANVTPANVPYTYQWYVDNVLIPGATNASLTVSPAARETAYNYHVVVTAQPGCIVTSATTAITVVADPVVVASVDNAITCVGGTATFTATVDGGVANINGLNGYTFAWYSNFSSTEPIATTPSYTTTGNEAADAYSYWVVVTSPYGCQTMSNVVNYTVVADPVVTVAVAQGYPTTVCDGGVTTLIANVAGGYGVPSYQWYKNGIQLYGETNPTLVTDPINYNQTADYTVVVTQTGVGCEGVSAAFNVDVVPSYTVDVTGYANVCVGGTVTMTAQVNGVIAGDVLTYQWYTINNGTQTAIYGANAPQYTTSPLLIEGAYEYFVVVTSSISGCSVTQSYSVNANVVADPTVQIVANGAAVICDGGNITLNAIVNGGVNDGGYVYTWNWFGADNGTATTTTGSYVPQLSANDPANPYYFTVSIARADNSGCASTSDAFQVNVLAAPSVQITADHAYVCAGGDVTFTANVAESGNTYNYVWTINGVTQATNSNTITTSLPTAGTITASVVVSNTNSSVSCSSTATLAVPVQVVADPVVTIAANHLTMCAGGTTTLSVQNITADSNIPADYSYQWAINGIEIDGAINSTFVQPLNDAGTYVYTLKVTNNSGLGCASTWSAPVTVQVAEQPVVALNSDYGLDICEGGSITLTGTVTNYGNTVNGVLNNSIYGPMTFNWMSNGTSTQVNQNITNAQNQITETLNTVGNYSYQVVVTPSGYACQPATSNIQTVNVVASPSWTDIHVLYPDVCVNSIVYLEAGVQGGVLDNVGNTNGQIQWTVTFNGVTSNVSGGVGGSSYDLPTVAGDYIYTPTWIGNIGSGCAFTNTAEAQTFVTVHELPTASFDSTSYGQTLCANVSDASAALVINFTGTAPFTFQLQDLETGIILPAQVSGTNTYTVHVAPGHTTQYRIIMVSDQYCENGLLDNADAIITVNVNDIQFDQTMFVSGCDDQGMVTIHFNMISGTPDNNFVVTYANGDSYTGTIDNNSATFPAPAAPGDYPAVFSVDGCNYDIVVRVLVGDYGFGGTLPIMDIRWDDVVVVNNNPETNGGHTFVGFQWYKNGVLIPGAIYSNYQEKGGLNGFYSVELIEQAEDGSMVTYMTCQTYFSAASSVRAYPVPANVNQEITIELDLSAEELEGAVLDIYNVTGSLISHVSNLEPITKISGFHAQGTYYGRILTGTNEIKTVKFVIVK